MCDERVGCMTAQSHYITLFPDSGEYIEYVLHLLGLEITYYALFTITAFENHVRALYNVHSGVKAPKHRENQV